MKTCSTCQENNPINAKFCINCGNNLQGICSNCGKKNSTKAKFCIECGTKLKDTLTKPKRKKTSPQTNEKHKRAAERRQLTILFCDLVGSTPLSEQLDPEDYRQVILDYQQVAQKEIHQQGGHIAQYLGDGLLVYFGYPKGLEDAPKAAIEAGLGVIDAVNQANPLWEAVGKTPIKIRIGIHTGKVVVDDHLALGKAVNLAARLEGIAPHNGMVISSNTFKLTEGWFEVKSMGEHILKGITNPMEVFQVLSQTGVKTRLEVAKSRGFSPLMGREYELQLMQQKWEVSKKGNGNLVLLNGEAGIGKSRLVDTFQQILEGESNSWQAELRCSPYHQNSAFHPIIELLENLLVFEPNQDIATKIELLDDFLRECNLYSQSNISLLAEFLFIASEKFPPLNLSPIVKKQGVMEVFTSILLNKSERQRASLIIEDLHWIDASTLEWLNLFVEQIPSYSIFTLCTTRPGFQAKWAMRSHFTLLTLNRLSYEKIIAICEHQSKGKQLPKEILQQIYEKTEGIPLFVEELTKAVLESAWMEEKEETYELTTPIPSLVIPSTLEDSLLARLDRLSSVKEILQVGCVIGREFSFELLSAVLNRKASMLESDLQKLITSEFIYQKGLGEGAVYQFKHALIQDVTYDSMLKSRRQELHFQLANVLEEQFVEQVQSQPELLAYHFTEAKLFSKAIPLWLKAGQLTSERHSNQEAIVHLEKGVSLIEHIDKEDERNEMELDFLLSLGGAYMVKNGYNHDNVGQTFSRARELAQKIEVTQKLAYILYGLQVYYLNTKHIYTLDELIDRAIDLGEQIEDRKENYLFLLFGYHLKGVLAVEKGEYNKANTALKYTIDLFNPSIHIFSELTPGGDVKINANAWLSLSLQSSGYMEQAERISNYHISIASQHTDPRTLVHIYSWSIHRAIESRSWNVAEDVGNTYLPIAKKIGDPFFIMYAELYYNTARGFTGNHIAFDRAREILEIFRNLESVIMITTVASYFAEIHFQFKEFDLAQAIIKEGLEIANEHGLHYHTAEFYRINGLCLQALVETEEKVEQELNEALQLSRKQSAKTYELRAARNLAELWHNNGRTKEAYDLLDGIYSWFTEGFEFEDLKEAKKLLNELAAHNS